MTLVAAFSVGDCPALISDAMITRSGMPEAKRERLELNGDGIKRLEARGRSVVYAKRKAAIITPWFVVAFAGSLWAAQRIIRRLRAFCEGHPPTSTEIFDYLTTQDSFRSEEHFVELTGWAGSKGGPFECFLWRSIYPDDVIVRDSSFIGKGAAAFEAKVSAALEQEQKKASAAADARLLVIVGECLRAEVEGGVFSEASTGIWFEPILLHEEKGFTRLGPILYTSVDIQFAVPATKPTVRIVKSIAFESHQFGSTIMRAKKRLNGRIAEVECFVDPDLTADPQQFIEKIRNGLAYDSRKMYNIWNIRIPFDNGEHRPFTIASRGEHDLIKIEDNGGISANLEEIIQRYER